VTILIACGLQREAKLLARPGIIPVIGGGDAAGLERRLEAALAQGRVRAIVSAGIAGALDPSLGAGALVVDARGWDRAEVVRAALPDARFGAIVGQDSIAASGAQKAALHTATGALAVDMESHVAARVAARHALPFMAIRAVSDTANETLPPAALVGMNPDGSMALGRVLRNLARHPTQLPALIRTGRSANAAFGVLDRVAAAIASLV